MKKKARKRSSQPSKKDHQVKTVKVRREVMINSMMMVISLLKMF